MERYLSNPNVDKTVVNTIQVYEGGTGGTTVKEAQDNLDILDKSTVGAPNGLAIMPTNGLFGGSIEGGVSDTPMIDGPSYVRTNQTNKFFITNYDIKTDYLLSTDMGSITREEDYLVFKSGPDVGVATIRVNNLEVKLDIFLALINMPNIVYPASGDDTINSKVEIKTTELITGEVNTFHAYTDWELSTTVTMDNIFKSVEKSANFLTNWKVEGLQENVTYYIRFRYWDNVGNKSSWSEITQFKTRQRFTPQTPVIEIPANGTKELRADVSFTTSDFFTYEEATHVSSDWQVSTSSVFAGLIEESQADEVDLTTWSIGGLSTNTLYYVRVRHTDNKGRTSDWSLPSRFTTRKSFSADTPTIVGPLNQSDNHNSSLTISASYFTNGDSRVTHQSSDWEISEDNSFQYPFLSSYSNSTAKVEWICKGLQPMTTYFVRVRYRDTMGFVTEWSKPIEFTTKVSFAPQRPNITDPGNGTTEVGPWLDLRTSAYVSNNTGDSHLNSDWEIGSSLTFKDLLKWNTGTIDDKIGWRVKGLEEASQYFVRVRHRSIVDGEEYVSDWSPVVNFTTKFSFAPGKPTITYPKSGSKDISENVTITSNNYIPSDSQDVHVNSDWEIATNSSFTDIVESNYGSAVAKTAWVVTNLRSLTTFFVRVRHRTINDGIYYVSEWSSVNNFTVEHEVPATPVILTPSNGSSRVPTNTMVTCSSYVAGEVEEKHFSSSWEISTTASFSPVVASSINSTTNKVSWTPAGLQANTNYFVRVKHIGSLGFESEWSDASQFTTKSAAVSSTPSIVSPSNGAKNVNTTTTVTSSSFSSSDSGDTHLSSDWELATDSSFSTKVKTSTGSSADKTSWNLSGLAANVTYYVRVRHNGSESGPTGWSSTSSFSTKAPDVIGQTSKPNITSPTNNATGLGTSFQVTASAFSSTLSGDTHNTSDWEVGTDSSFGSVVKSSYDSATSRTSWSVGGLAGGSTYYVRVRYKGLKGGLSPWSDGVKFTTRGGGGEGPDVTTITEVPDKILRTGDLYSADASTIIQHGLGHNIWVSTGSVGSGVAKFTVTDTEVTASAGPSVSLATAFDGLRFSTDGNRISFISVANLGPGNPAVVDTTLAEINPTYKVLALNYTDPEWVDYGGSPQSIQNYGGSLAGDGLMKTVVRGVAGALYMFKETDTDTGLKMSFVAKVRAPAQYEAQNLGQSTVMTDDGKVLFALADNGVLYIFSVEGDALVFKSRLKPSHTFTDIHWFNVSATGDTFVLSGGSSPNAYIYQRKPSSFEWELKQSLTAGVGGAFLPMGNSCISEDGSILTVSSYDGAWGINKEPIHTVFFYQKDPSGNYVEYKKHTPPIPSIGNPDHQFELIWADESLTTYYNQITYAPPWHFTSRDGKKTLLNGTIYGVGTQNTPYGVAFYIMVTKGGAVESVTTPSITSPSSGASLSPDGASFTSSAFSSSSSGSTHASSDWEISTNSAFTTIVKSAYASTSDKTSWNVSGLAAGATYYVRVKHVSSGGAESAWSNAVSFSTTVVQVPGGNGKIKFDAPGYWRLGSQLLGGFRNIVTMSKSNDAILTTISSTPGGYAHYAYLKLNRDQSVVSKTVYAPVESLDGPWMVGVSCETVSADGLKFATLMGIGARAQPSFLTTFNEGSSNITDISGAKSGAAGLVTSLLPFSGGPGVVKIDTSDDMSTVVVHQGNGFKVYRSIRADDGSEVYAEKGTLAIPQDSIPSNFGRQIKVSGDGRVAVIMSDFGYAYIYAAVNDVWSFQEKIQLSSSGNSIELSYDGSVIAVGSNSNYSAATYTKVGNSWNNPKIITPPSNGSGGSNLSFCCISGDGTTVSVSVGGRYGKVHIYKLQPSGDWGEVGVIDIPIPEEATSCSNPKEPVGNFSDWKWVLSMIAQGQHRLSGDGSTCLFVKDGYYFGSLTTGAVIYVPELYLAY